MARVRIVLFVVLVLLIATLGGLWLFDDASPTDLPSVTTGCAGTELTDNAGALDELPLSAEPAEEPEVANEPEPQPAEETTAPGPKTDAPKQKETLEATEVTENGTATISGRVVDGEGNGVKGVRVALVVVSLSGMWSQYSSVKKPTDTDGCFIAPEQLHTSAHGHLVVTTPEGAKFVHPERFDLSVGSVQENVLITLPALTTVKGRVTDPAGAPIRSKITVYRPEIKVSAIRGAHNGVETNDEGQYEFELFEVGAIQMKVEPRVKNFETVTIDATTLPTMETWVPDIILNPELNTPMQIRIHPVDEDGQDIITPEGVHIFVNWHFKDGGSTGSGWTYASDDGWMAVTIDGPDTTHITVTFSGYKESDPVRFTFQHDETLEYGKIICKRE